MSTSDASRVHTAGDGQLDVGIANYDGTFIFYGPDGAELAEKLHVPRLAVAKVPGQMQNSVALPVQCWSEVLKHQF